MRNVVLPAKLAAATWLAATATALVALPGWTHAGALLEPVGPIEVVQTAERLHMIEDEIAGRLNAREQLAFESAAPAVPAASRPAEALLDARWVTARAVSTSDVPIPLPAMLPAGALGALGYMHILTRGRARPPAEAGDTP